MGYVGHRALISPDSLTELGSALKTDVTLKEVRVSGASVTSHKP